VVAGASGLDRQIRWVHILEISSLEKLIYGNEMILATGVGFNLDAATSVSFMDKLIQQNAACLCIEIGPYFHSVSEELLELADRSGFPLILFPHSVRFVDITQDLHSLIINRHHRTLRELEGISREFHRLTLTAQGTLNVLKLLYKSTHTQLLYRPLSGNPVCYPPISGEEQASLLQYTDRSFGELNDSRPDAAPSLGSYTGRTVILKPIGALNQTWAYLALICSREPVEYDYLLLDSASLSIAQELLRTRYMEERKLFSENLWVDELMNNRLEDEKQIKALTGPYLNRITDQHFRVCIIEIENLYDGSLRLQDNEWEPVRYHMSLILRSTLEKHGFRPFITLKNNRLAAIAVDLKNKARSKERLQQALESLTAITSDDKLKDLKLLIGVGKAYSHLKHAYSSHQEAIKAISIHASRKNQVLFYEELGVFQLLINLNDGKTLQQFIRSYLGPVIDYDLLKGSDLLTTLKVYLDHDGAKQIAAQKLYIVRQSLYYRLEKIKELLGEDFMSPENRISIQVALRSYQLLHPEAFGELQIQGRTADFGDTAE
jgi:PucR family transcriptional regulator, purine catabolism regulatory protein